MTHTNNVMSMSTDVSYSDVFSNVHNVKTKTADNNGLYSTRCQEVLKLMKKQQLMLKTNVDGNYILKYPLSPSMQENKKEISGMDIILDSTMGDDNDNCQKENKVKRSLNVCLLQNNGSVAEGREVRTLKRARRSLSEKSDSEYDSLLNDVVPLQNIQLSDSDNDLEELIRKFSLEQKLTDFELSSLDPDKITCMNRDTGKPKTGHMLCATATENHYSLVSVSSDEQDDFVSINSQTWLSSTPSQKTFPSPQSKLFDAGSPITESCVDNGISQADLKEDMEESIRLEAKSMSLMFQHEARHASSHEENAVMDYDDFLTSTNSDVPSEIYSIDSEEEEVEIEKAIVYGENNFPLEEMCCCKLKSQERINEKIATEDHVVNNAKRKVEKQLSVSPLSPAVLSKNNECGSLEMKPSLWSTPRRSPQRRPLKAVVPLLEMVQSAKMTDMQNHCHTTTNVSSPKGSSKNAVSRYDNREPEYKMFREPIAWDMVFLSLPFTIPPKRRFEQLLCPLFFNYELQVGCNSSIH